MEENESGEASVMLGTRFAGLFMLTTICLFVLTTNAYSYLDPGTGSYVFQVLLAAVVGSLLTIKMFWKKIKDLCVRIFLRKWRP